VRHTTKVNEWALLWIFHANGHTPPTTSRGTIHPARHFDWTPSAGYVADLEDVGFYLFFKKGLPTKIFLLGR